MTLFDPTVRIVLTAEERTAVLSLSVPETHSGGAQTMYRSIREALDQDGLVLDDDHLLRLVRYAYAYGSGGYQQVFRLVIRAAHRAGWTAPAAESPHRASPQHRHRRWAGEP